MRHDDGLKGEKGGGVLLNDDCLTNAIYVRALGDREQCRVEFCSFEFDLIIVAQRQG